MEDCSVVAYSQVNRVRESVSRNVHNHPVAVVFALSQSPSGVDRPGSRGRSNPIRSRRLAPPKFGIIRWLPEYRLFRAQLCAVARF
jgi:hypothetical protein